MNFSIFFFFLTLFSAVQGYVPHLKHSRLHSVSPPKLTKRADDDPSDFSWVKRWAAIGDSYTAGIGSGRPLGSILDGEELDVKVKTLNITLPNLQFSGHGNWYCARYDMSYPMIISRLLGSQVESFQYAACSGDRAGQIYQQAEQIEGDLDMVMLAAGGNDLCLAGIISDCILLSANNEEACEAVLKVAEENVENIVKNNVKEILYALNKKVNKNGIVVVLGYAEFFSTEDDSCEDEEWDKKAFLEPIQTPQTLTIARRHRFNALVRKINRATADAVNDIAQDGDVGYKIGFADWNPWVTDASIDGQMCSPSAEGDYPSKDQPQMQFIKPPTNPKPGEREDLKKRGINVSDYSDHSQGELSRKRAAESIWRSRFFNSANPQELVRRVLGRGDPKPPGCPSDDERDWTMGLGLPNTIAENFHPNENGHVTMASFAMAEAMDLRSLVLGIDTPSCEVKDEFKCWSDDDWKIYSSADRLDRHYEDFCNNIEQPEYKKGWVYYKSYKFL
ncbi:hypothetical protein ACHAPJ_010276 [Fusarium lateritium]